MIPNKLVPDVIREIRFSDNIMHKETRAPSMRQLFS